MSLTTSTGAVPEGQIRAGQPTTGLPTRLPTDAERIAGAQLDGEVEATRSPATTEWYRRAVADYLAPDPDLAAVDVPGVRP
ncbi:hypothetical protein [Streptomyces nojiriensis]|uniref:hypothetical protein n=1 Tax=Streptomyces nojiriensis TaxID=66374 RepID=UPI0036685EDD